MADFNSDGRPDLGVVGDKLLILLGNGKGGFSRATGSPVNVGFGYGIATDFNGDGKIDIAEERVPNRVPE